MGRPRNDALRNPKVDASALDPKGGAVLRFSRPGRRLDSGRLNENRLDTMIDAMIELVINQLRRRRQMTLETIAGATFAAITGNLEGLPVAFDDIRLALGGRIAPANGDVLRLPFAKTNLKAGRRGRDRIASLGRAMNVAKKEHRNGVTPLRIVRAQPFAQIGLAFVELQLDGFCRGIRQTLVEQHQFTQVGARDIEIAGRIADTGVVANKRRAR